MSCNPIHYLLIACLILCDARAVVAQNGSEIRKVAFLVGISDYQKADLRDLDYPERDVSELRKELEKYNFKVTLLLGSKSGTEGASLDNIKVRWGEFLQQVQALDENDLVIVGLSGHGRQMNVKKDDVLVDDEFFCPVDCLPALHGSLWSLSDLMNDLGTHSGSSNNLFMMDACRLSTGKAKGLDGNVATLPKKLSLLLACSAGQEAHEYDDLRHGLFTYHILEGLRGAAVNAQGAVTWGGLAEYVLNKVTAESKTREKQKPQKPNYITNLAGASPVIVNRIQQETIDGKTHDFENDPRSHGGESKPFKNIYFTGVFDRTDFSSARFEDCRFENCRFINSVNVYGARMVNCRLIKCNFQGANTDTLTIKETDFGGVVIAQGRDPREE